MIKKIEKFWSVISILLILLLVFELLKGKPVLPWQAISLVSLSILAACFFSTQKYVELHRRGSISRPAMWKSMVVEGFGILISLAVVMWIARAVAKSIIQTIGASWGAGAGILAAILATLVIGIVIGPLVRWIWTVTTSPRRIRSSP